MAKKEDIEKKLAEKNQALQDMLMEVVDRDGKLHTANSIIKTLVANSTGMNLMAENLNLCIKRNRKEKKGGCGGCGGGNDE